LDVVLVHYGVLEIDIPAHVFAPEIVDGRLYSPITLLITAIVYRNRHRTLANRIEGVHGGIDTGNENPARQTRCLEGADRTKGHLVVGGQDRIHVRELLQEVFGYLQRLGPGIVRS